MANRFINPRTMAKPPGYTYVVETYGPGRTAYIAGQWKVTHFDPPKVACAYNAGGIYHNDAAQNRWKMRQYPIGTAEHANRFVKWFNDCFEVLDQDNDPPQICFVTALRKMS